MIGMLLMSMCAVINDKGEHLFQRHIHHWHNRGTVHAPCMVPSARPWSAMPRALAQLLVGSTSFIHMLTPLVAVLLMLLVVTREGSTRAGWGTLGLQRMGLRSWPLALLTPLGVLSAAFGLVWSTGVARVVMPAGFTVASLSLGFVQTLVFSCVFALSEEIGFRGYLLPRLAQLGTTRSLVLSGLLHALWHLPLILLTPYYHG